MILSSGFMPKTLFFKNTDLRDDAFPEEIIDTFFKKSIKQPDAEKIPPISPKKKQNLRILFVISLVLALALAFSYYLINPKPFTSKKNVPIDSTTYNRLVYNGVIDKDILNYFSFEGDAKEESSILINSVKLVNKNKLGWARATFQLNTYIDLSGVNILILGKCVHGLKSINLILDDIEGNSYQFSNIGFSPDWELKNIELENIKNFNFKKVQRLAIEFGTKTSGNTDGSVIYIKEMGFRKKGGN